MADRRKSAFSSLASTQGHAQLPDALLAWVRSLPSTARLAEGDDGREVDELKDLADGVVLGGVLLDIDAEYFRNLANSASNQKALSENWVLRFNNLKRVYKLIIRYFEDVLHSSTTALHTPNLQNVAKSEQGSDDEVCKLAGLHIERIQSLDEWVQRELMYSIEQVMSKVQPHSDRDKGDNQELEYVLLGRLSLEPTLTSWFCSADSEFYHIQHEKSRLMHDKEALQVVYEDLVDQYNQLKEDHAGKNDRADQAYKAEIDRLRTELQKTENQLSEAEQVVERQTKVLEDLTRKVDELAPKAEEAIRLKDQMDEYRHASEKAKKQENVIEKYKKKLEEAADLRRNLKTLEDQNSDLLDKNAALEEEYDKISAFKPLMESYKSKLDALETKSSSQAKENNALRLELDRTRSQLRVAEEEREKEGEALVLYEERVKELELGQGSKKRAARDRRENTATELGEGDPEYSFAGVGEELDDAITGTTTTDLKLQIRRLERQLKAAQTNQADSSRIVVLENLLEDANRMKARYEGDYLREHREKLVLSAQLEEIMSGKSRLGDGPEAAMALRQRLNETVDDLEKLRREYAELDVKYELQHKELTIVKSDLNLVNKDQVEVLRSLRASVSVEKDALSEEVDRLKSSLNQAEAKAKLQIDQVNKLLLEKISLQEADQARVADLENENSQYREQVQDLQDKLQKAKAFIKQQDKLFKEAHAAEQHGNFDEAEQSYQQQISQLRDELERQKINSAEIEATYHREQQLMLSAWHDLGMKAMRQGIASSSSASAPGKPYQPQSWLSQQRQKANGRGLRNA
ncbi:SPOSA6832_02062, partial [Sporobolomyces salmonicolor]